jgi:regulator of protease activity HflC (stomatin/prohibitin superfamily)
MGNVGIKVNLTGSERGASKYEYKTGWVVCNSWTEQLYEFPVWQQHIAYDVQEVVTKGGFLAKIKPTFNYSLKPDKVGDMFTNLRLTIAELEQGWLQTAIIGSVQDVSNRWEVDAIFNKREKFESEIVIECNKRLSKWFIVTQLRTNIVPPEALVKSITDKTKAIQDAQVAVQQTLVVQAQALKKIALARGDSAQAVIVAAGKANAVVIEATGEAKAMREKQRELTPLYVEYTKALGWDGKVSQTVLGTNTGTLVNLK